MEEFGTVFRQTASEVHTSSPYLIPTSRIHRQAWDSVWTVYFFMCCYDFYESRDLKALNRNHFGAFENFQVSESRPRHYHATIKEEAAF